MRIARIRVKGFRSLRDATISLSPVTVFIGPNGSGKSSALLALRLFFSPQEELAEDDLWRPADGSSADEAIIGVTFSNLTEAAAESLSDYLSEGGDLTVEKVFDGPGLGSYLVSRLAVPDFSEIRKLPKGQRDAFNELADSGSYVGLERAHSKDRAFELMEAWEKANPDRCQPVDEEVDLLRTEPGSASALRSYIRGVFIGALDDPETHVQATGRGALSDLLGSVTDMRAVEEALSEIARKADEEAAAVMSEKGSVFEKARSVVGDAIDRFAPGLGIDFGWGPRRPTAPTLPPVLVSVLGPDGLSTDLAHQGHGIQRSVMFAILTAQAEVGALENAPTVLVTIEEPEAFQHPLSGRSLARTFQKLGTGSYQIVYSTHSPDLVAPSAIEGLRIFSRVSIVHGSAHETIVRPFSLSEMAVLLQEAVQRDDFTAESAGARLEANLDPRVLEGLFARLVVIVEGDEDEALVRGGAQAEGIDLDDAGIAVIRAHGKTSIPLLLAFFLSTGIDVYPIFDLDRNKKRKIWRQAVWVEDAVRRMLKVPTEEDLKESQIGEVFCCWEDNFGAVIRREIETYEAIEQEVCDELGYAAQDGRKVGPVIRVVLERGYGAGNRSASLDRLTEILGSRT